MASEKQLAHVVKSLQALNFLPLVFLNEKKYTWICPNHCGQVLCYFTSESIPNLHIEEKEGRYFKQQFCRVCLQTGQSLVWLE